MKRFAAQTNAAASITGVPEGRAVAPLGPGDRTIVIGAGPAGLTAAWLLARAGHAVTVLESDAVVGGIARTAVYKGYRFDIGGHRFFTKIAAVQRLWEELLGEPFLSVPRLSRIHYRGRFFNYPLRIPNVLSNLGVVESARCVGSYLQSRIGPRGPEENFEQWVTHRFGRRLYEMFFKTYTEKVWGIPCTEIRAEWAAQRIQNLSLWRAVLNAAAVNRRSGAIRSLIHEFNYPRLGPGQMWERTRDRLLELGAEVRMGHAVEAVEVDGDRFVAVRARTASGVVRVPGQHCISTMPVGGLACALDPPPSPEVMHAGAGLRHRDLVLVALILDGADLFPDNWIYIHTPGVKVGRVQNFNNWSAAMVPEPGRTCLGLEYFAFRGDPLWESGDAELIALAKRELGLLGLADPARVVDGCVVRMPRAYPIYDGAYRDHLATVRRRLDPISNLHPVGRNGLHKYNNQDHSMLTAMLAVENMKGARHDVWAVNTDFEYHEEQRVGSRG